MIFLSEAMRYLIAVDPDVDKSGVAVLNVATQRIEVLSMTFPELLDYLCNAKVLSPNLKLYVEAGWLNKKSNFHGQTGNRGQRVAKNVGANHQVGKLIIEMAKHYKIDVSQVPPLRKCWKGKDGKITQEEIEYFIPGFPKRTNQDSRDSALLAWYHAGLPIKVKTAKSMPHVIRG